MDLSVRVHRSPELIKNVVEAEIARGVQFNHDRRTEAGMSACAQRNARARPTMAAMADVSITWIYAFLSPSAMSSPPVATAMPPSRSMPPTENVEQLRALLRKTLRVSVTDGRVFLGTFAGTDKQLNILLINTDEYRLGPDADSDGPGGRYVGQVMIPWRLVVRVETQAEGEHTRGINYHDSDEDSMYA